MKTMRKIVVFAHTGYAGMDGCAFVEVNEDTTDDELDEMCHQFAVENADSYGIYPRDEYADDVDDADSDDYSISDNIEGWYEDYLPEKHDGQRVGKDTSWEQW